MSNEIRFEVYYIKRNVMKNQQNLVVFDTKCVILLTAF